MSDSPLHLWFGVADLILAIAVASAPALWVFEGQFDGCMGGIGVLMCWAAAAPFAVTGLWLLVQPRSGRWAAIVIGVAAVILAACVANEYGVPAGPGDWLLWYILLPGILQLPIGLWLRRAIRTEPAPGRT